MLVPSPNGHNSQEPGMAISLPWVAGSQALMPFSAGFQEHQQEDESEVEQPIPKLALTWDVPHDIF